ncbi:DUF418 domain-containing protein [Solibacillus cecembensis]|uniref:DUF418 domain-containing protein n=1 Tax=Solibacillus cecembensis TaxID=459347 RepID=UPI003D0881BF
MKSDIERIYSIDIIRGIAIMGIFLININSFISEKAYENLQDSLYGVITGLLIHGKFHFIFAFLFGVGSHIFLSRLNKKGLSNWTYIRRMSLLFVFGLLNAMMTAPDVLMGYAVIGIIFFGFMRFNKYFLLVLALILTLSVDIYYLIHHFTRITISNGVVNGFVVGQTLGHMLLGYTMYGIGLFDLKTKKYFVRKIWIGTFILSIGIVALQLGYGLKLTLLASVLGLMYITGTLLVLEYKNIYKWCKGLVAYGQMSLTNYIIQSICGITFIASQVTTVNEAILYSLLIFIVQIIFSNVWMKYFHFGPLEWLWRTGTYMTVPKFKK